MSLFSRSTAVIWPKAQSVDFYWDKKESNKITFEINLWSNLTDADLEPIAFYCRQNHLRQCHVIVPNDIWLTKSFVYDSQIEKIDQKEVLALAKDSVPFELESVSLEYELIPAGGKTIIQAQIKDQKKLDNFSANLAKLNLTIKQQTPLSKAVTSIISQVATGEYLVVYPTSQNEFDLILAQNSSVYLTQSCRGTNLDLQKIINYSNLFFSTPTAKVFYPQNFQFEFLSSTSLLKTGFSDIQIATNYQKPSNLPIPVIALIIKRFPLTSAIMKTNSYYLPKKTMEENKKNILPIIAIFVFTAAVASIIIWVVLNRNKTEDLTNPKTNTQATATPAPTVAEEVTPTEAAQATPTAGESAGIDKKIKIQILNATDINGQAATLKEKLVKLGFKNITVGNSSDKETANIINYKSTLTGLDSYFEEELPDFPATFNATLKASSTYDAVFIIGTDLKKSSTTKDPTPTVKKTATPTIAD